MMPRSPHSHIASEIRSMQTCLAAMLPSFFAMFAMRRCICSRVLHPRSRVRVLTSWSICLFIAVSFLVCFVLLFLFPVHAVRFDDRHTKCGDVLRTRFAKGDGPRRFQQLHPDAHLVVPLVLQKGFEIVHQFLLVRNF